MDRIHHSFALMRQSWAVLRHDKELALFPVISAIASFCVLVVFALGVYFAMSEASGASGAASAGGVSDDSVPVWLYVVAFAFYFVTSLVTIYFNSALIAAAMIRLRGGDPTLGDGLRWANRHLGAILGWAVLAATVGFVLRWLQERAGFLGSVVIGLVGLAWQLITYFVIPVIIFENAGTLDAVKRSAKLFKQRWGEQVIGAGSIGLAAFFLSLVGIFVIVAGIFIGASAAPVLAVPIVLVGILYLIGVAIVAQAMQGIYNAALYKFAVEGDGGGVFPNAQLAGAFVNKKGGGRAFRGFGAAGAPGVPDPYSQQQYHPGRYTGSGQQTYGQPVAPADLPPGFVAPGTVAQPSDSWHPDAAMQHPLPPGVAEHPAQYSPVSAGAIGSPVPTPRPDPAQAPVPQPAPPSPDEPGVGSPRPPGDILPG